MHTQSSLAASQWPFPVDKVWSVLSHSTQGYVKFGTTVSHFVSCDMFLLWANQWALPGTAKKRMPLHLSPGSTHWTLHCLTILFLQSRSYLQRSDIVTDGRLQHTGMIKLPRKHISMATDRNWSCSHLKTCPPSCQGRRREQTWAHFGGRTALDQHRLTAPTVLDHVCGERWSRGSTYNVELI